MVFNLFPGIYTLHLYPRQSGVKINELRIQKVLSEEPFSEENSAFPRFVSLAQSSPDPS